MNSKAAIVVIAFNRAHSLNRLLQSIEQSVYSANDIALIISIDKSETPEIYELADAFNWQYGVKTVLKHASHLGLKEHVLRCGDLTEEHDSVIILEDDLIVSPYFYEFASEAERFYLNDESVAGISLYNYQVAESCFYPFQAMDDGSDVYFIQVASSWGQLFTKNQWRKFRTWFKSNNEITDKMNVPDYLFQWGKHSWKKHFIHYLIDENKYFVFPQLSLSTNCEELGTNSNTSNIFHVPVQANKKAYHFKSFQHSINKYDAWFEPLPQQFEALKDYSFDVDLYGIKPKKTVTKPYVLTSQQGSEKALVSYANDLKPLALNIKLNVKGNKINLYATTFLELNKQEVPLVNVLNRKKTQLNEINFVFIINILDLHVSKFTSTVFALDSLIYENKSLIILDNSHSSELIYDILSGTHFKFHYLSDCDYTSIQKLDLNAGDVVNICHQGDVFLPDSLVRLNSLFNTFVNTNWVMGVEIDSRNCVNYDDIDVSSYRKLPYDYFNLLRSDEGCFSLSHNFFKYNLFPVQASTEFEILMHLVLNFQQNVIIDNFIIPENVQIHPIPLEAGQKQRYLQQLEKFKLKTNLLSRLYGWIINSGFFRNKKQRQWFLKTEFNYPYVFRWDRLNFCYFLSSR